MSFTINTVHLVGGNLTRDIEVKHLSSGAIVGNFDIAINKSYTNKTTGDIVEKTSYFRIVFWGKLVESLKEFLKKGQKVGIKGELEQRRWTTEGNNTRSVVEINAEQILLMWSKPKEQNENGGQDTNNVAKNTESSNGYNQAVQKGVDNVVDNVKEVFNGQEVHHGSHLNNDGVPF